MPITLSTPPARFVARARVPRRGSPPPNPPARRGLLAYWFVTPVQTRPMRVALAEGGYLGIAFLLGGVTVLLARYWFSFTDTGTASLLAVLGVALGGLGLLVAGGPRNLPILAAGLDSPRRMIAGALFALAAACTGAAAGVIANGHAWFAGSLVGLVVAITGYLALPTVAGLLAGTGLGLVLTVSTVVETGQPTPLSVGTAMVAFGILVASLAVAGLIRQRELGLSLGAVIALAGAQQPLARSETVIWACMLTFAVGAACLAVYPQVQVTLLLPVGVAGVSVAVLEATWTRTTGQAGLGATLVATGIALIASSAVGLQLWRTRGESRRPRRF